MICVWARALRSTACPSFAESSGSRRPEDRICDQPRMALRGVRSSWDKVAKNSSFIRLAVWRRRGDDVRFGVRQRAVPRAFAVGDTKRDADHAAGRGSIGEGKPGRAEQPVDGPSGETQRYSMS